MPSWLSPRRLATAGPFRPLPRRGRFEPMVRCAWPRALHPGMGRPFLSLTPLQTGASARLGRLVASLFRHHAHRARLLRPPVYERLSKPLTPCSCRPPPLLGMDAVPSPTRATALAGAMPASRAGRAYSSMRCFPCSDRLFAHMAGHHAPSSFPDAIGTRLAPALHCRSVGGVSLPSRAVLPAPAPPAPHSRRFGVWTTSRYC